MGSIRNLLSSAVSLRYEAEAQPLRRMFEEDKRHYLADLARQHGMRTFIETGTYLGKTAALLAEVCDRVVTVEINPELHARAAEKFNGQPHVRTLLGDSGEVMPKILDDLADPALFWLDGHYSGGITGGGGAPPILAELEAIFEHDVKDHIIVVDDGRLFRGRGGYPRLGTLARFVTSHSDCKIALHSDLIRIQRQDI